MCILLKLIPIYVWIKLNITQATEKIEIYRSNKKKTTNKNPKNYVENPLM